MQRQEAQARALQEQLQIAQIPEPDRERVRQGFNANRNRFAGPLEYYDAMRGQSVADLQKENAELRAKLEQKRDDTRNGVVNTVTRPVPSREAAQRRMTIQQFSDERKRLVASGEHEKARQLTADFAEGRIQRLG